MLLKILLTAGLIYIAYIAFFKKPTLKSSQPKNKNAKAKKEPDEMIEEMVQCAQCGTYVAQEDIILSMGRSFCSKECIESAS